MSSATRSAVVAGHVCLDVIPTVERPIDLAPGRLYDVGAPLMATGGAVSNTGIALHLLDIPTVLMGKVGDDSFGQTILDIFRGYDERLTSGMKIAPGATSSYSIVLNIPGRDRTFLHCPGANDTFCQADLADDAIAAADLFHFGYPPLMASMFARDGAELAAILKHVRSLGTATSLDMAMPDPASPAGQANWARILQQVGPHLDLFLPSADELLYMLQRDLYGEGDALAAAQVSELGERLLDLGVAVAGLKLGERGLYIRTASAERLAETGLFDEPAAWAEAELWFPVFQVADVVGATGAGDTTIAGFLAGVLRGLDIEQTGLLANSVGALNVQAADALSGLKGWAETRAFTATAALTKLSLSDSGWRQMDNGLWAGPHHRQA